jgi:hypothetical protein
MVEVIVSAVLLIVLAMATLPLLDQAGVRAGGNKSRGVASSLAQSDQDRMRQMTIDDLANYTDSRTKTVEGVQYTIASEARWVRDASGFVTCAVDPSRAEYVKIMSTVSWPRMAGTKPVVVESFVAPGVTALGPAKGTLTVKLQNAAGGPQPGIPVTAGGLAGVTDAGGCYVFAQLNAGTNTVAFNSAGYVDRKHVQNSTQSISVAGGATSQLTDMYDRAITLRGSVKVDSPVVASTWTSMTAVTSGTGVTSPVEKVVGTAAAQVDSQGLFPTTAGYGVYAGRSACTMNEPTQYRSDYYSGAASPYKSSFTNTYSTTAVPTAVDVFLRRISVTVSSTTAAKYGILVKPAGAGATASCEVPARRQSAASVTSYTQDFEVPWGQYRICVDNGLAGSGRYKDIYKAVAPFNATPTGSTVSPPTSGTPTLAYPATPVSGNTDGTGNCA